MFYLGDTLEVVGYDSDSPVTVIVSPTERHEGGPWYWDFLDSMDVITYVTDIRKYQYANLNELVPMHKTIGELIKEHEGVQGIQFSTDAHGNVQAAYIRGKRGKRGGMKLVSMGDGLGSVTSKI